VRPPRLPRETDFGSRLRGPEVAARVGLWLGICFLVAFLTGLYSHAHQDQPAWLTLPTRPVWTYRVTQGLHYLSGVACVPLLLVKLFAVYPRLFAWPDRTQWRDLRRMAVHALERGSIALLVAASLFQLATGIANAAQWYPWSFSFRATHYAVAWVAVGALALHVAVKLPLLRDLLRRPLDDDPAAHPTGLSRRGLLVTTYAAAGLVVVSVAGNAVPWLRRVSVFSLHDVPDGGIPINTSARRAGVTAAATDASYALRLVGPGGELRLTRAELTALPQHRETLPIACVEGWSASGEWSGVRLRDLVSLVGAPPGASVRVGSLQQAGPFRESEVRGNVVDDPLTLVALGLDGEALSLDHGFPCRLVAPGRPGVLQTKWLAEIEVLT